MAEILFTILALLSTIQGHRVRRQAVWFNQSSSICTTPSPYVRQGRCVNIGQCPLFYKILQFQRNDLELLDFIKQFFCYYIGKDAKVCCPGKKAPSVKSDNIEEGFPGDTTCGISTVNHFRVIGGQPADLGAWPWMAALGYMTKTNSTIEWQCGGSLITENYIITAAHCLEDDGNILALARLGDLDLDDNISDGATPIDVKVEKTITHELYDAIKGTVDIGLVKLVDKVTFTKTISPICLPFSTEMRSNSWVGYQPFVAGFGRLSGFGPRITRLQEVQMEISDIHSCAKFLSHIPYPIDESVICAGNRGNNTCKGDSGGPLMLPRGENFFLIGITSIGEICGESDTPGVYTRVSEYVDWIAANVD